MRHRRPPVEVWYTAVDGSIGTISYDVRDFTPEAIRALLSRDARATFSFDDMRDAEKADGTFPRVLFSHESSAVRLESSLLTSHLASHEMIVVAPDHPSRDLFNAPGGSEGEDPEPVGLDADTLAGFELDVIIEGR